MADSVVALAAAVMTCSCDIPNDAAKTPWLQHNWNSGRSSLQLLILYFWAPQGFGSHAQVTAAAADCCLCVHSLHELHDNC